MGNAGKKVVTLAQFVDLMNHELRNDLRYQDAMHFVTCGTGYDLEAPSLSIIEKSALAKTIFDQVSTQYTIVKA